MSVHVASFPRDRPSSLSLLCRDVRGATDAPASVNIKNRLHLFTFRHFLLLPV